MKTPGFVQRHPELKWLVSAAVVAAVAILLATSLSGVFRTEHPLPATNPVELTAQVKAPHAGGYSGTIVTRTDLQLPDSLLSAVSTAVPVGASLLNGSHTMRYWYGGPEQQRVAVLGATAEQDVFRNGSQILTWDTSTHVARRDTLSGQSTQTLPLSLAAPAALTPPQLADEMLGLASGASDTTLRSGGDVAHRPTYELVIRPDVPGTRVSEVHIDIDGYESVPLGVQIYTAGNTTPAVDVAFQSISFAEPVPRNFSFTPPKGARIESGALSGLFAQELEDVTMLRSGWTSVASYPAGAEQTKLIDAVLGPDSKRVKGSWGSGRLLDTPLLCVLVTDKGRLLSGAVTPSVLYEEADQ